MLIDVLQLRFSFQGALPSSQAARQVSAPTHTLLGEEEEKEEGKERSTRSGSTQKGKKKKT